MLSNKVLIVEDDPIVGMHISSVLKKANYEVLGLFTSGAEAIDFVRDNEPGIILMDVMLEGAFDGIETSMEINKIRDTPVIYLTGVNDSSTINRAKITFPYSFMSKPFAEMELLANVELTLFKHKFEIANQASQQLLSTILAEIDSGVVVVDRHFKTEYVNKFVGEMLNIPTDILVDYILGEDILLTDLNDELIKLNDLEILKSEYTLNKNILNVNFAGRKYPINNIYITAANFFGTEDEQFLIMFSDASLDLERLKFSKLKEQQQLAAQLQGVENERVRISRDLHDGIGQMLNLLKMKLSSTDTNVVEKEIFDLLNQTIEEVRKISDDLMPSKLREFDLQTCLNELCHNFKGFGVEVDFRSNLKPRELENNKINIYRIVQEAFSNSLKHSKAKKISLQLYKDNSSVQVTIEDDGIGFDTKKIRERNLTSHGLMNIKDRVIAMRGEMDLSSNSQFGTSIIIHLKEE